MTKPWTWEFDEEDDIDNAPDIYAVTEKIGKLLIEKMKITNEGNIPERSIQLNDEDRLIEEMRAVGIEYRDGFDKTRIVPLGNLKEEHESKIIFQGRVPVFVGDEHFYVRMKNPKKSQKEKRNKEKKVILGKNLTYTASARQNNPFRQQNASNPFNTKTKGKSYVAPPGLHATKSQTKNGNPLTPKKRRKPVAQQILESVKRQKSSSKKKFKKFDEVNFNPKEPTGPTIGMAGHKYCTAREVCLSSSQRG